MRQIGTAALLSATGAAVYGCALIALDALIAYRYGLGDQAAVFQAAYQITTVLINILSGGAILGALLPLLSRSLKQSGAVGANSLLASVSGFIIAAQGLVVLVMIAVAPQLVDLIASGFSAELRDEATVVLRLLVVLLVLNGLASIGTSALLASGRVVLANLAPALWPMAAMLSWPLWNEHGARWIAWGCLVGVTMQVVFLTMDLRRERLYFLPALWPRGAAIATFIRGFVGTSLAHAALSALLLINTALAGAISERDLAAFSYGSRPVLLALAFVTSLVNNVVLPYMAELAQRDDVEVFRRRLFHIVCLATVAGTALAGCWFVAADWIVDLLYARGSFGTDDAAAVAQVQRFFVLQAPFSLAGVVCWRALNVSGAWRPLVLASVVALLIDIVAAATLAPRFASAGIAGAHALGMALWSVVLLVAVRSRAWDEPERLRS